mgnify:CR=1 FL=1
MRTRRPGPQPDQTRPPRNLTNPTTGSARTDRGARTGRPQQLLLQGQVASEADCQRLVEANDAVAWGAAFRARGEIEWGRFEVPAVGYLGDGESMREQACFDAQRFGFPMAVLPTGGHMETFTDIDPVMALVAPFLNT